MIRNRTQKLRRNIVLYTLIRIFFKRSYLPIIAIFAVVDAGLALPQIGVIAAITSAIALIAEVPSGYVSDRIGHRNALIVGAVFVMCAPLWPLLVPHFWGMLGESVFFFVGYAFHSGTAQALLHDTLRELGEEERFGAVNARAQKYGLLAFVVLVTLVPISYRFHHAAPFALGFVLQSAVLIASLLMVQPRRMQHHNTVPMMSVWALVKELWHGGQLLFFFFVGLSTGVIHKLPEYREILLQDIGVAVAVFGVIVAAGNLFGAVLMHAVVRLEQLPHRTFYFYDMVAIMSMSLALGIFAQGMVIALVFVLIVGYARVRQVVMHAHLLAQCAPHHPKATYLSLFELFSSVHRMWLPLLLGASIGSFGVQQGYLLFGGSVSVLLLVLYVFVQKYFLRTI